MFVRYWQPWNVVVELCFAVSMNWLCTAQTLLNMIMAWETIYYTTIMVKYVGVSSQAPKRRWNQYETWRLALWLLESTWFSFAYVNRFASHDIDAYLESSHTANEMMHITRTIIIELFCVRISCWFCPLTVVVAQADPFRGWSCIHKSFTWTWSMLRWLELWWGCGMQGGPQATTAVRYLASCTLEISLVSLVLEMRYGRTHLLSNPLHV